MTTIGAPEVVGSRIIKVLCRETWTMIPTIISARPHSCRDKRCLVWDTNYVFTISPYFLSYDLFGQMRWTKLHHSSLPVCVIVVRAVTEPLRNTGWVNCLTTICYDPEALMQTSP